MKTTQRSRARVAGAGADHRRTKFTTNVHCHFITFPRTFLSHWLTPGRWKNPETRTRTAAHFLSETDGTNSTRQSTGEILPAVMVPPRNVPVCRESLLLLAIFEPFFLYLRAVLYIANI